MLQVKWKLEMLLQVQVVTQTMSAVSCDGQYVSANLDVEVDNNCQYFFERLNYHIFMITVMYFKLFSRLWELSR